MVCVVLAETFISKECYDCDITPRRKVEFYEIELYRCGNGITCVDDKRMPHKKNRFVFAKPGEVRFSHGNFECEAIHFSCSDIETRDMLNKLPDFADLDDEDAMRINDMIQKLYKGRHRDTLRTIAAIFGVLEIAFSNAENSVEAVKIGKYTSNVMAAKDYIDENFSEQLNLNDIAEKAYLSPNFLRVEFEKFMGVSPHRYLLEIRLSHACKRLKSTSDSLAEIAYSCGFKSQSYMNYVFKKKFKLTPKEYRQEG